MDCKYYVLVVIKNRGKMVDKYYRLTSREIDSLEFTIRQMYPRAEFKKYRVNSYIDINNIHPY